MGQLIIPDGAIVYVDMAPIIRSTQEKPDRILHQTSPQTHQTLRNPLDKALDYRFENQP
jgi:hypothetical protein